jgi:FkbM family methyltransferase
LEGIVMPVKTMVKSALLRLGVQLRPTYSLGVDPFRDMRRLIVSTHPEIVDVGANEGQSIRQFRRYFERSFIHSFEPSPTTFARLRENTARVTDLRLINVALGSQPGVADLIENTHSGMSSFLELGPDGFGQKKSACRVPVTTLDEYCASYAVKQIDILKVDTQGFDLEVLKGGQELMAAKRIRLIYLEIIFSRMYKNLPRLDEIYAFLIDRHFELVSFYQFYHQNDRAGWTDALFAVNGVSSRP